MEKSKKYRVNTKRAISETLNGETIIINLENGVYYSLNETGSEVWNILLSGVSVGDLHSYFVKTRPADTMVLEESVNRFLDLLLADNLVEESESVEFVLPIDFPEAKNFIAPILQKYEDMQEMLLADPIHDVDNTGWPSVKK